MLTSISWRTGCAELDLPEAESPFWQGVAGVIAQIPAPAPDEEQPVRVECDRGSAHLTITARQPLIRNGVHIPQPTVFAAQGSPNTIALEPSEYGEAYLTFLSPESKGGMGNYKFYRLIPSAEGIWGEYGRIGQASGFGAARRTKHPYPSWLYWPKYQEKLLKGYTDLTDVYLAQASPARDGAPGPADVPADESQRLYARLMAMAEAHCNDTLLFGSNVTAAQAERSRELLGSLRLAEGLDGFNAILCRLMQVAPRRTQRVASMLAASPEDFADVVAREENLVRAMEAIAEAKAPGAHAPSFASFGIQVKRASAQERALVMSHLCRDLASKALNVWSVRHDGHERRFAEYSAHRRIGDTRLLWHGSPNGNWASIVLNGLSLSYGRPGMFGRALYFSDDAVDGRGMKSWGYTTGGHWRRGASDTRWMALFECAYGTPYEVSASGDYSASDLERHGADCIHAYAGCSGLRNEEIMFYDDAACKIAYLVEFSA